MKKYFNRVLFLHLILATSLLTSLVVHAMLPPLSKEELEKDSNIIAHGTITAVKPTGEKSETKNAKKVEYLATFKVAKTIKGAKHETLYIKFTSVDYAPGYTGGADHFHHEGETGIFYLSCNGDQCRLTHWNGVDDGNNPFLK